MQCNADSRLTLTRLQAMSNLEVLTLMLNEVIWQPSGYYEYAMIVQCGWEH